MSYQNELGLLTRTLQKSHISVKVIVPDELANEIIRSRSSLFPGFFDPAPLPVLPPLHRRERYCYTDAYGLSYTYLLLSDKEPAQILLIGPYLSQRPDSQQLLELGEQLGLSPELQQRLEEYTSVSPVLPRENPLFLLLDTFCEQIWHSPSFAIIDVNQPPLSPASPIHRAIHTDRFDDILLDMKAMEQRYAFENELIRAVTLGQMHLADQLFAGVTQNRFEQRVSDRLRNTKNYCIIMNTLLRKAAENGGVHPLYINRVSSDFARRIEQLSGSAESASLMSEMFRGYCMLVQQHSLRNYSKVVQTAILLIDSDLAADLSLHSLAQNQNISPGYLSTVFKKETGKTVTAYIHDKRMQHAQHLLSTTNLQIQTVALHCGILDVHYFSKTFKKEVGVTPGEYRRNLHYTENYPI